MPDSPTLLSSVESCDLRGFWDRDWETHKIELSELLQQGIRAGLTSERPDFHEAAGERVMGIAAEREIFTDHHDVYAQAIHTASIADIVSLAIRKPSEPPWDVPEPVGLGDGLIWTPACFLAPSGTNLRHVVIATAWSHDKHYAEARSWYSLGETCIYGLPMQQAVIVLGQHRDGKRHGYWSKGYRHPINRKLRLKRKNFSGEGFKDTWQQVWREDWDDIPTKAWLAQMLEDDVLKEVAFSVEIQVPPEGERQRIVDMAKRKLERLYAMTEKPEPKLTGCDFPFPCGHRNHCHKNEPPSGRFGFVRIS